MSEPTSQSLSQSKCVPCEGGVPELSADEAKQFLKATPEWTLSDDAKEISRQLNCKRFMPAIDAINRIAELAESEGHHPDLHLTGYRHLRIGLTTHAIGGLSENDFILAAKIDSILEGVEGKS